MPAITPLPRQRPAHLRPRREKLFGDGRPRPLDRNAKVRIMVFARALMRRTEKGKAYGVISAKALAVLQALLWGFHNARSGLCFPSYETIAARAGCARSTVAEAVKALEDAGILSWVHRIVRIREKAEDLLGKWGVRSRVIRTSNAYHFRDPGTGGGVPAGVRPERGAQGTALPCFSSKSEKPSGTSNQDSISLSLSPAPRLFDEGSALDRALMGLGRALGAVV